MMIDTDLSPGSLPISEGFLPHSDDDDLELVNHGTRGIRASGVQFRTGHSNHSTINQSINRVTYDASLLDDHDDFEDCSDSHPLMFTDSQRGGGMNGEVGGAGRDYTVEDAIEHIGMGWFQVKLILICGLLTATDALEMLLLSVLSPELRCEWELEEWQVASITTVVFIGMFLGSNLWGSFADSYGRLATVKVAAVWIAYFGFLTSQSPNYIWILILRCLVGAGFGGAIQSFTLLSEFLPSKYRAKILIIYNVTWTLGCMFEVLMAYLIIPTLGWRVLVIVSAAPTLLTIVFIWILPESARYLLAAGRTSDAEEVLLNLATTNKSTLPPGRLVPSPPVPRGRVCDLFVKGYARTAIQTFLLWFGVATVYYGVILTQSEILEMGGVCGEGSSQPGEETCRCRKLSSEDYLSMIIATVGEFVAIPINLLTVDWLGRRITLGVNFLLAGGCFLLVQICGGKVILTIFLFGVRAFISAVYNIVYIYTSEVFPTTVRSIGLGSGSAMARVGAMITPFIAQVMLKYSVRLAVCFYAVTSIVCGITAFLLPIETRGRAMPQTH